MKNQSQVFIDVDYYQHYKHKQQVPGDIFLSRKISEENRLVSVLSDGLGSGIKANVLATLTSTMALQFIADYKNIQKTAETIMQTLPIDGERQISYSTFTIIDIDHNRNVRIIEYDNPEYILYRNQSSISIEKQCIQLNTQSSTNSPHLRIPNDEIHDPLQTTADKEIYQKQNILTYSEFPAKLGDRLIFFSDGVSQSGIGTPDLPLGWELSQIEYFIGMLVNQNPNISARELAKRIVNKANRFDNYMPYDDITCAVIYFRQPREVLWVTGPPIAKDKDSIIANHVLEFSGKTIISGGTTAKLIARELKRSINMDVTRLDPEIPPASQIQGIDLVTEGTITLNRVLELLHRNSEPDSTQMNAATELYQVVLDSDIIHFIVGTKINDAHQDPNIPVELSIRRNLTHAIAQVLEQKYLKEIKMQFI